MKIQRLVFLTSLFFTIVTPGFGDDKADVTALSLQEVSQLAIKNSYDIQLLKYDVWLTRSRKGLTESIYDTVLSGEIRYRNDQSKKTSTIFGDKTIDNDYNVGLTKKLPTGTTLSVDMENNRNASDSAFATSSVSHDSALGVSLTQSLGRNIFGQQDRGSVKITESEISQSQYTSLDRIEEFLASVQKVYWDLAAHIEKKVIEEQMVQQAQKLLDSQREKFNDGLVEKAELIAADANYQQRQNDIKILENVIRSKASILRLMLNVQDQGITLVPSDMMTTQSAFPDEAETLKAAFANRWDYKTLQAEARARNIRLSVEKNSLWPQIDLQASFKRNGLGDHFNRAIENISQEDNPDLTAVLLFSFPLENSKASAQWQEAKLSKARNLVEMKRLERKIVLGVMDQRRDCQVFKEVAVSQEAIASLQKQKFYEETKRFQYGRSSIDQIIRFQEDVLSAQLRAVEAKKELMVAMIELERRQGLLLKRYLTEDFLKD